MPLSARHNRRWLPLVLLLLGAAVAPAVALDSLSVGRDSWPQQWDDIEESSSFVGVAADSVWMWPVQVGENLALQLAQRGYLGARVMRFDPFAGEEVEVLAEKAGMAAWVDGDPGTAWNPNLDEETERRGNFYIDLGGTFQVDRIRFFPRLDRANSGAILGAFELGSNPGPVVPTQGLLNAPYQRLGGFTSLFPNRQPVVDLVFPSRPVRYIRLAARENEPWELAEFEVYADGAVPTGEFTSIPLFVRGGFPVWGRVRLGDRDVGQLPLVLQTRTGPDPEPLHYYIRRGDDLERTTQEAYLALGQGPQLGTIEEEQGPILPNPAWSTWETVSDGQVLSPSPSRYLQFRLFLSEPGTLVDRLVFEYVEQPLLQTLGAEIDPTVVRAGEETQFTLSMVVQLDPGRGDTGVRYLQVETPALIEEIERVLVDDEETLFTATHQADQGFTIDIWRRVVQAGSFVQIVFRARLFRDGTPFRIRALDLRPEEGGAIEPVYQTAREEDVEPLSVGASLTVRLDRSAPLLLDQVLPDEPIFTPNGDGVNDALRLSFNLLKLLQPARVAFQIYDLSGRRIFQGAGREIANGAWVEVWDGTDAQGRKVPAGFYLYQLEVHSDSGVERRSGAVRVAY